jgi:hypothetical protein
VPPDSTARSGFSRNQRRAAAFPRLEAMEHAMDKAKDKVERTAKAK